MWRKLIIHTMLGDGFIKIFEWLKKTLKMEMDAMILLVHVITQCQSILYEINQTVSFEYAECFEAVMP